MSTPKSLLLIGLFAVLGLATAYVCDDLVEPLWDSYKECGGGRCFCRYSDCGTHKCCFKVRDQYEDVLAECEKRCDCGDPETSKSWCCILKKDVWTWTDKIESAGK